MSNSGRALLGLAAGVVLTVGLVAGADDASAKGRRGKVRSGPLRVVDFDKRDLDGVFQNDILEITFTTAINPGSVNPALFQVRQRNATGTGFARQIAGSFQLAGNVVRFYPRLPTHLRDPASASGDFYPVGTPNDSADDNAGLQPSTQYELRIVGGGTADAVRSTRGRRLAKSYVARFRTTAASPKSDAFTVDTYADSPPPGFQYSNPADKVATSADQYARHGGTREVPNAVTVSLFGNRVPLSPALLRKAGNITLTMTERGGDPSLSKPIRGTPFLEQNISGVRVDYKPNFPLPDRGTFALRVSKDVKDLTEQYDFRSNPERLRLREIYEFLVTAQALAPGTPPADLPDPPIEAIFDWPASPADRGVLKTNLLSLGTLHPDEVDPRVMVLFTTRDEPVSSGAITFEFEQGDGLSDLVLSSGDYSVGVPGAASASLTIAGGNGVDGDFTPTQSQTIMIDTFPNNTVNWRKVVIPPGIRITISGTRPATLKCYSIKLEATAEILADGLKGADGLTSPSYSVGNYQQQIGGIGGPGGGRGGNSFGGSGVTTFGNGYDGTPGNDKDGTFMALGEGGQGGQGGFLSTTGTLIFDVGGGGGGGGARLPGENGAAAPTGTNWFGSPGGAGGAGSSNPGLVPFGGGAGGGGGASGRTNTNSTYNGGRNGWGMHGGSGGGGGGALLIQTADTMTIETSAAVRARGGPGGKGSVAQSTQYESGPGGGGGGGSLLLRSTKGFNFGNPATATDVRRGARGTAGAGSVYGAPYGGAGGDGYVLIEDTNGGAYSQNIPGAFGGTFDPVGGGPPSVVYTNWVEVGVEGPRFLNFTLEDFLLSAAGNDAILIEIQMAIEDPALFGKPLLASLLPNQDSTNENELSAWTPVRVVDLTGIAGGAFGQLPNYDLGTNGTDYIFPVADILNGFNYRFVRVRVRFQLDDTQSIHENFPFVDRLVVNFQFNL